MCSRKQLAQIMYELMEQLYSLFGVSTRDVILFGSYAREEADDSSDIDVMVLIDMPREQLLQYRRRVAEIAGNLLYDYGTLVSPLLESKDFFDRNKDTYPLFRNIDREGVRYAA